MQLAAQPRVPGPRETLDYARHAECCGRADMGGAVPREKDADAAGGPSVPANEASTRLPGAILRIS